LFFAPLRLCATLPRFGRGTRRAAFTLVELSVSVGILALMLALAAVVFKWTLDSTGQAKALTDVNDRLRVLEEQLREDLRYVVPSRSMMIVQTSQVNAHWTKAGREADQIESSGVPDPLNGYPHPVDPERENVYPAGDPNNPIGLNAGDLLPPRADVLMFFTARPGSSFNSPQFTSNLQQVVYGHAELGELDSSGVLNLSTRYALATPLAGTFLPGMPQTTLYLIPAHDWHLFRRSVLISDVPKPQIDDSVAPWQDESLGLNTSGLGALGVVGADPDGLTKNGWDIVGRTPSNFTKTFFDYTNTVVGANPTLPGLPGAPPVAGRDTPNWYARSQIDLTLPPTAVRRLGAYFLPNCASFKVEWTCIGRPGPAKIPLQQMLWFDMQRPNPAGGTVKTAPFWDINPGNPDALQAPSGPYATLAPQLNALYAGLTARFIAMASGPPTSPPWVDRTTPMWFASDPLPGATLAGPDPYFPTALKITVDVFDPNNRFARPIRHVMVLPVGEW
jgi:type II secretory pathway pseudopilin PulG